MQDGGVEEISACAREGRWKDVLDLLQDLDCLPGAFSCETLSPLLASLYLEGRVPIGLAVLKLLRARADIGDKAFLDDVESAFLFEEGKADLAARLCAGLPAERLNTARVLANWASCLRASGQHNAALQSLLRARKLDGEDLRVDVLMASYQADPVAALEMPDPAALKHVRLCLMVAPPFAGFSSSAQARLLEARADGWRCEADLSSSLLFPSCARVRVLASTWNARGLFLCIGTLVGIQHGVDISLFQIQGNEWYKVQRRRSVRIPGGDFVKARVSGPGGGKPREVEILNVSAVGIGFAWPQQAPAGTAFECCLDFAAGSVVVAAISRRCQAQDGTFWVMAEFLADANTLDKIARQVHRHQLAMRRTDSGR